MLPGDPRRWLLISREKGISAAPGEGARWAVDHLLVDQDARPTLVEVKRGWNPDIRRNRHRAGARVRGTCERNVDGK